MGPRKYYRRRNTLSTLKIYFFCFYIITMIKTLFSLSIFIFLLFLRLGPYELMKEKRNNDANGDSVFSTVVERALELSGVTNINISDRILHTFRKKLYCLEKAYAKASKMGGKCVKQLLKKWDSGEPYRFKLYYNEIDTVNLKNENIKLRKEKREMEESLTQESLKRFRVEEKLNTALKKAETKQSYYKKRFKNLAKKVAKE